MQASRNRKKKPSTKTSAMRIAFFILLVIAVAYSALWTVVTKGLTPDTVIMICHFAVPIFMSAK
jgi:hypothetical protein